MRELCVFVDVERPEFCYRLVLYVNNQVVRLVGGMPYLDFFADEFGRTFIECAADGNSRVVFDMPVQGYLEGGVEFFSSESFCRGVFDVLHKPVYRTCVDTVMHVSVVFVLKP